jgi:hypothetical protein
MRYMTYTVGISEDGELSAFRLFEEGKALGHITLDPTATSVLITQLAKIRAEMKEGITPELDPGALVPTTELGPAWQVPNIHTANEGTVMLLLRHRGYGWIGYLLEPERAREMGTALINAKPSGGRKPKKTAKGK